MRVPVTLDLATFMSAGQQQIFDLAAVILHSSGSLGGGHYWAIYRDEDRYVRVNDDSGPC